MTTNAQAALQSATTYYSLADAEVSPDTVKGLASVFKLWLDRKDAEDAEELDPHAPEQEVSHHISCASRIRSAPFPCDCDPVEYTPRHRVTGLPMATGGFIPPSMPWDQADSTGGVHPKTVPTPGNFGVKIVPKPGPGPMGITKYLN